MEAHVGLEMTQLVFAVEERTGTAINDGLLNEALTEASRGKRDFTASQLLQAIQRSTAACKNCHYDLRGHAGSGICPECGTPFNVRDRRELQWEELQEMLADIAWCAPDKVTPDTLVVRDLAFG
jgi:uncharacterized paraquat-inducible protein A